MIRSFRCLRAVLPALVIVLLSGRALAQAPTISFASLSDETRICSNLLSLSATITWGSTASWVERYEYRVQGSTTWNLIAQLTAAPAGASPFTGQRNLWTIPGSVPEGRIYLRVSLSNTLGTATAVSSVYIDRSPPALTVPQPLNNAKLRGIVLITGTALDASGGTPTIVIATRPSGSAAAFTPVTPGGAGLPAALGSWDTNTVANGLHELRITATDPCSNSVTLTRLVDVSNLPPKVGISTPAGCDTSGEALINVLGRSDAGQTWVLEYAPSNGSFSTIATGTTAISPGTLVGVWNAAALPRCLHVLRLRATNEYRDWTGTPGYAETSVPVDLRCAVDFDRSGTRTIDDIFIMLNAWFAGCP